MTKIIISVFILILCVSKSNSQTSVGVALPLMSFSTNEDEKKPGEQMLKGIQDALEEYNAANSENKILLKVGDTKKDQAEALAVLNKLGSDSSVIAILGPVYSSELVNNAGSAAFHKIPVITPTATHNFLAEKSEYVFQLNPTYDIRGRIMAKYAMNELGMKNFVILSEEEYGKNFADSFTEEVNKNGGSVTFVKYYSKDKIDLTEEVDEVKNAIFANEKFLDFGKQSESQIEKLRKVKFNYSRLDSLINEKVVVSIFKLFGKRADKFLDSLVISYDSNFDKSKTPILGYIDAVYLPISNFNEITKVAPQYFSGNINLPILGTSDWNNLTTLLENKIYLKDLFFDSDFFLGNNLKEGFENLSDMEIRNYYFGYDGMKLILDKISEGNTSRESLNEALQRVADYKAVHNNVTMKRRTNHAMSIMVFKNGNIEKIKDYVY